MESVGCCFAILSFCHPLIFKWIWCHSAPEWNFTLVLSLLQSLFTDCNKTEVVAVVGDEKSEYLMSFLSPFHQQQCLSLEAPTERDERGGERVVRGLQN